MSQSGTPGVNAGARGSERGPRSDNRSSTPLGPLPKRGGNEGGGGEEEEEDQ